MNSIEEILRLKESILEYQKKIPETEKKITEMSRVQLELDDKALRAKILEEKGWEKLRDKADENRTKILELKEEIPEAQKAIEILRERQKELRPETMNEFKKKYRKQSEEALKEFAKQLKQVFESEKKLVEQRREISREVMRVIDGAGRYAGYGVPELIMVPFRPVLTGGVYESFSQRLKEEGISID